MAERRVRPAVRALTRFEVALKPSMFDAAGAAVRDAMAEDLGLDARAVRIVRITNILGPLTPADAERIRTCLLTDPVSERSTINEPLGGKADWVIEVGFRPGVTDNVARTVADGLRDTLGPGARGLVVHTATQFRIRGSLTAEEVERVARDLLANELIERWAVLTGAQYVRAGGETLEPPADFTPVPPRVERISLDLPPDALRAMSQERMLALSVAEMEAIQAHYREPDVRERRAALGLGPEPTDVELEALAQTWSEHCKHKIFAARVRYDDGSGTRQTIDSLFNTYIRGGTERIAKDVDWLLSVFHDNAGVIRFTDDWSLVMKVETHNSPSALDPYGGALTGIVGCNRDPFGTGRGARLIFNTDTFCFAPPNHDGPLPPRLLHPKRIFKGVHRGVRDGANQSGIPDVNGSIVFDERFLGKPLVFCGTGGLLPATIAGTPGHEKRARPGDLIVMAGGDIGKDGIHGATFSSEELHEGSPVSAVQIGDPIVQKKMTDFLLEARDRGLYTCITDNGAGGLSSSVGEMAQAPGGCELHLDRAPLKYAGLQPWEILLSEAQERMTLAVPPDCWAAFQALAARRDVTVTALGEFTASGQFIARFGGKVVAALDMAFFHDGVPQLDLPATWVPPPGEPLDDLPEPPDLGATLKRILGRLNVCSKETFVRQYDHEVQGASAIKPFVGAADDGPGDAAVLRPLGERPDGVVVASGLCPRYSDLDAYHMAAAAVDEAVRNAVCVGGSLDHMAGLDNFCWPDPVPSPQTPDAEYKMAQLVRANQALYDVCTAYGVPCISGKDSMKNDYRIGDRKISIPPTLLFSVIGVMPDVEQAVTMDAKRAGDLVYVVGETAAHLGGSEYAAERGRLGARVPTVDTTAAKKRYRALTKAIRRGLVRSCHDCSDGGLGVALAETAFAGGLGMRVDLRKVLRADVERDDFLLFSESQSRFVVTVAKADRESFARAMRGTGTRCVGAVTRKPDFAIVGLGGQVVVREDIAGLKAAWQEPLAW